MKANKVIYFNEASGKLELCSNGDVYNIAELNIYGHKYIPQRHLEKLILDKKVTYTRFSKGLSLPLKIVSTKNDFFRQFTDRYFSLEFSVLSIDDEQIIINCSEKVDLANGKYGGIRFNLFDYPSIGKIKTICNDLRFVVSWIYLYTINQPRKMVTGITAYKGRSSNEL